MLDAPFSAEETTSLCTLSIVVVAGVESTRSLTLLGSIQDQEVTIMVDLGSSHTFVSSNGCQALGHSLISQMQLKFRWLMVIFSPAPHNSQMLNG